MDRCLYIATNVLLVKPWAWPDWPDVAIWHPDHKPEIRDKPYSKSLTHKQLSTNTVTPYHQNQPAEQGPSV